MAAEMLNKVLNAEQKAALDIAKADNQADEILSQAKNKAEAIMNAIDERLADSKKQQSEFVSSITEKLMLDAENEAKIEAKALNQNAKSKLSEAVGIVKGMIAG